VIVVRDDEKDIKSVFEIEIIAKFCLEVVKPKVKQLRSLWVVQIDGELSEEEMKERKEQRKALTESLMTEESFVEFFGDYKKKKIEDGEEIWEEVKAPFDND
jgi:hypothetical protein